MVVLVYAAAAAAAAVAAAAAAAVAAAAVSRPSRVSSVSGGGRPCARRNPGKVCVCGCAGVATNLSLLPPQKVAAAAAAAVASAALCRCCRWCCYGCCWCCCGCCVCMPLQLQLRTGGGWKRKRGDSSGCGHTTAVQAPLRPSPPLPPFLRTHSKASITKVPGPGCQR